MRRGGLFGCQWLKVLGEGTSVECVVESEGVELIDEGVDWLLKKEAVTRTW